MADFEKLLERYEQLTARAQALAMLRDTTHDSNLKATFNSQIEADAAELAELAAKLPHLKK